MALPTTSKLGSSSLRFRQRKISVKQPLLIYKQKDLHLDDLEPLNISSTTTDTGVDKNEEDEIHLKQIINQSSTAIDKSLYIPTPDASLLWNDASLYYNSSNFIPPASYIKYSATIEDTLTTDYNMDEEDEAFLNELNSLKKNTTVKSETSKSEDSKKVTKGADHLTESEFEMIMEKFEKIIEERQPFLSVDPTNLLSFKELSNYILQEVVSNTSSALPYTKVGTRFNYLSTTTLKSKLSKELNWDPYQTNFDKITNETIRSIPELLKLFGEKIYTHWRSRKLIRKGKVIHPILKFEDPSANEKDNDADPYICFRRREFRQARKTRRADTLGAERIRLLQKSLQNAREIVLNVAQREILKLKNLEVDLQIFNLRNETKTVKRAIGYKGDDHLFYPHKRKKVQRIRDDEEIHKKEKRTREQSSISLSGSANVKQPAHQQTPQENSSTSQPYVKLPPSKIPDMDLVTVSLVLKEKNETIKRAVSEKLRKRKEQDKGHINLTDDPYQPYFNVTTNSQDFKEVGHVPYSSIAAANYHQINTSNYLNESVRKLLEEGKKALPGVKTVRGSNGELIPSKAFPHVTSLLKFGKEKFKNYDSVGYISQLLSNIESGDYTNYNYGHSRNQADDKEDYQLSEPLFRLRKRVGRNNKTFIDRRSLIKRPDDILDEFLNFDENENGEKKDIDGDVDMNGTNSTISNGYDSRIDVVKRLDSRWKFDTDLSETQKGVLDPFGLDPSRLNSISDDTQSIRFGSMLLSKSYGLLRDEVHRKQQLYIQQVKLRQHQQSRQAQQAQSIANSSSQSQQPNSRQQLTSSQRPIPSQPLSRNLSQLPNANYSLASKPPSSSSPQLSSQPNSGRQNNSASSQVYNSNNVNRGGNNYTDTKLTNNFNAQNIKHYNKTSPIASSNSLATPVSATHK